MSKIVKTDEEWRRELTPEQYRILRESGTERPHTGALLHVNEAGTYQCAACGNQLFRSDTKFDSGCGWPSFFESLGENATVYIKDTSHGMIRTEVRCGRCDSHLGHVFPDGPPPTGQRYCMNSVALKFTPEG